MSSWVAVKRGPRWANHRGVQSDAAKVSSMGEGSIAGTLARDDHPPCLARWSLPCFGWLVLSLLALFPNP